VNTERITVTILDGGTVLASGVRVTIYKDASGALDKWRCQFDRPQGVSFHVGRYYRIQTEDGRAGACSCSGVSDSGLFLRQSVVKMTGLGPLK
jgi:hypothetical protein